MYHFPTHSNILGHQNLSQCWHLPGRFPQLSYSLSCLQLEALAVEKYGSMDDVKAERQKRFRKRAERAEQRQEAGGKLAAALRAVLQAAQIYWDVLCRFPFTDVMKTQFDVFINIVDPSNNAFGGK